MTGQVKIFEGSLILVQGLENWLEQKGIPTFVKNHIESAHFGGIGALDKAIELFVLESDLEKSTPILKEYLKKINS